MNEEIIEQETMTLLIDNFKTMLEMGYAEEDLREITPNDVFENWFIEATEEEIATALDKVLY